MEGEVRGSKRRAEGVVRGRRVIKEEGKRGKKE
jgi:hypothetical protein